MIISFHEGWSDTDLETGFFNVGFFVVADLLVEVVVFLVALDLARDDLGRAGDFLPTAAASGAGEARGDGSGEDIISMALVLVL